MCGVEWRLALQAVMLCEEIRMRGLLVHQLTKEQRLMEMLLQQCRR